MGSGKKMKEKRVLVLMLLVCLSPLGFSVPVPPLRLTFGPSELESLGKARGGNPDTGFGIQSIVEDLTPMPFVVLHGLGDACSNTGMSSFVSILSNLTNGNGTCLEIGNGAGDSWTMPMSDQAEIVCTGINNMTHLSHGFNLIGLSQGALLARAYIEYCDGPIVNNLITLGGPMQGVASIPECSVLGSNLLCEIVDLIIKFGVYTSFVQNHLAPAGYVKIPTDLSGYFSGCTFLPYLNNEIDEYRDSSYSFKFSSLNKLVLVMFNEDNVLYPRQTSLFGYYADNSFDVLLTANQTKLYVDDLIGLRTLDEAGKVDYVTVSGGHLEITIDTILDVILPNLLPEYQAPKRNTQ